jgi:hypothetical protein
MPIDMRRPLVAAIRAALDEVEAEPAKKRHGLGAGRALVIGAGLYTAGRVVTAGRGRALLDAIQQRLPVQEDAGDHEDDDAGGFDDEFDEDGPQAEADEEEPVDEADDEGSADEADEDLDEEEPVDEAGEDEPTDEATDEADQDVDEDEAPAPRRTRGRSGAGSRR